MTAFPIDNPQRSAFPKKLGALPLCALEEASLHSRGDAGVEGIIGAEDDVDLPVHPTTFPTGAVCIVLASHASIVYIFDIYFLEVVMRTAKIFQNGQSQAVRLPKEFRFDDSEVFIKKSGNVVQLIPRTDSWNVLFDSLKKFSGDFMSERSQPELDKREDF